MKYKNLKYMKNGSYFTSDGKSPAASGSFGNKDILYHWDININVKISDNF